MSNGFHHRRIYHQEEFARGKNHINDIESLRGYAKSRRKTYHGGFKHTFKRLIGEMEFRFNHHDDDSFLDHPQGKLLNWSVKVR
jgi:transposase